MVAVCPVGTVTYVGPTLSRAEGADDRVAVRPFPISGALTVGQRASTELDAVDSALRVPASSAAIACTLKNT